MAQDLLSVLIKSLSVNSYKLFVLVKPRQGFKLLTINY